MTEHRCKHPWWGQFKRDGYRWRCPTCRRLWEVQTFIFFVFQWVHIPEHHHHFVTTGAGLSGCIDDELAARIMKGIA